MRVWPARDNGPPDFQAQRLAMVHHQIRDRGIRDERVLEVMSRIPREQFVPENQRVDAYDDRPLSIGAGQTISQPYMVALMTEALRLAGHERVLEIGTGSGYQTAILAALAREVCTIERVPEFAPAAARRLAELGVSNVHFHVGDGTLGWPQGEVQSAKCEVRSAESAASSLRTSHCALRTSFFDAILVTAGAPSVPPALTGQLTDGGRLVIPAGDEWGQDLLRITKCAHFRRGSRLKTENLCRCVFVKLIGEQGWT